MKVLHKYEVGIIMGVGGVILPLSMHFLKFFTYYHDLNACQSYLDIDWPLIKAMDALCCLK